MNPATGYTWKPLERAQVAFLGKKHLSVIFSTHKASRSLDNFSRLEALADVLLFPSGRRCAVGSAGTCGAGFSPCDFDSALFSVWTQMAAVHGSSVLKL